MYLEKDYHRQRPRLIKTPLPIELLDNEITEPGFMESDKVAHRENSSGRENKKAIRRLVAQSSLNECAG